MKSQSLCKSDALNDAKIDQSKDENNSAPTFRRQRCKEILTKKFSIPDG
jgi:hypothetical protein